MSAPSPAITPAAPAPAPLIALPKPSRRRPKRWLGILGAWLAAAAIVAGVVWQARRMYRTVARTESVKMPVTRVKRGDLTLTVAAKGALRGGNSELVTAPLTGGGELHITQLRKPGDLVKEGDMVLEFDPTDQEYKLKEALADVAENKMKVEQAIAQSDAESEEARYALLQAESDVKTAELDVRKNPLLPTIAARQNDLALKAAQDRTAQLKKDLENRGATNKAAIEVQKAALAKAEIQAATAQKNIDALQVKAHRSGYVSIRANTSQGFFMDGMSIPTFQIGDTVRAGMAVAEIPDMNNWEIVASMGEMDRGRLTAGNPVQVQVIALPGKTFTGKVADLGGTAGPPWNRRFECKMKLDNPSSELRPGMSVRIVVTTETMKNALWLPAQSVFESGNRTFVWTAAGDGFVARDVKLVRKSESQAIIEGLPEGQIVALADPEQEARKKERAASGPAIPK